MFVGTGLRTVRRRRAGRRPVPTKTPPPRSRTAMDGRWKLLLAGGLVAGLVGCKSTPQPTTFPVEQPAAPVMPAAPTPPTSPTPPAGKAPGKAAIFTAEPADEAAKKDGPLAPATLVTFANAHVDA